MSLIGRTTQKLKDEGIASTFRAATSVIREKVVGVKRKYIQPLVFKLYEVEIIDIDHIYSEKYYEKMKRKRHRKMLKHSLKN